MATDTMDEEDELGLLDEQDETAAPPPAPAPRVTLLTPPPAAAAAPPMVAAPGSAPVVAPPVAARPYSPAPGYNPTQVGQDVAITRMLKQMGNAPIAEAEAAVATALKFQATRGYQKDLQNGVSPAEALTKWAPLMFTAPKASTLGQAANLVRAGRAGADKVMDIGGQGYLYDPGTRTMKALTPPKITAPPANRFDLQEHASLLGELRRTEVALDNEVDQESPAAKALREKLQWLRGQAGNVRQRTARPAAAPPATGKVRVRHPNGKIGSIPASQLDEALAAGYTRM